jgi:large subunit ribosomal protein L23
MVRPRTERSWRAKELRKKKPVQIQKPGFTLEPHQIIVRPLVTEKGVHRSARFNQYAFEINRAANKNDVRRAVEELFNVKVLHVATQNRKGKVRRTRMKAGRTQDWKKAIVKLGQEDKINFF